MGSIWVPCPCTRTARARKRLFFVVGGVVFLRVPSEFLPFLLRRSVSPPARTLSARVPRSVFKHSMFKHTFRVPPAFRVPTYKT